MEESPPLPGRTRGTSTPHGGAPSGRGRVDLRTVVAGACGALAPVVFVASVLAAGEIAPGYDATRQAISELFATGAKTTTLVKGGILGFAVLAIPFAAVLRRAPAGGLQLAAAAVAVDAVGSAALVLAPCSPGCPGPTVSTGDLAHVAIAGVAYLGHVSAPLLAWWQLRRRPQAGRLAGVSLTLGLLALAGLVLWLSGAADAYRGLVQRAFTIAVDLWFVVTGVAVARAGRPRGRG